MSVFGWCARRAGGLSMVALVLLCYWVISDEAARIHAGEHEPPHAPGSQPGSHTGPRARASIWTYIFAYYTLFTHLALMGFPLRACYAVTNLSRSLIRHKATGSLKDYKSEALRRRGSSTSVSSSETLISDSHGASSSASSSDAGDIEIEAYTDLSAAEARSSGPIVHAIVIPNYKEEVDSLKETLEVLASHPQAQTSYDVSEALWRHHEPMRSSEGNLALACAMASSFRAIVSYVDTRGRRVRAVA